MRCFHINIRQAAFIILSIIVNNVNIIQTVENTESTEPIGQGVKHVVADFALSCPINSACESLNAECLRYTLNYTCVYGAKLTANCTLKEQVKCAGDTSFERGYICRYCYQTEPWEHTCEPNAKTSNCNAVASPPESHPTNCTVHGDILCLGNRTFNKNVRCNWTSGYRWTTALLLSVTLGGFGADRFYLGHWQEGIGKLFSFGGLGVWTLIDVILISLHYLGPADGSLYI